MVDMQIYGRILWIHYLDPNEAIVQVKTFLGPEIHFLLRKLYDGK